MSGGRPSDYNQDIADDICKRLSDGELLTDICKLDGFPARTTVFMWQRRHEEFKNAYAQARVEQMHTFADEILKVSRDDSRDTIEDVIERVDKKTGEVTRIVKKSSDNTAVQRDRLRVDSMKFLMARLAATFYGDKMQAEVTGKDGAPFIPVLNFTIEAKKDGQ